MLDDAHLDHGMLKYVVSLISIGIITTSNQYSTESKIVGKYLSLQHIIAQPSIPCIVSIYCSYSAVFMQLYVLLSVSGSSSPCYRYVMMKN